ncbi:hypothetical protein [Ekhidna sp. MALMAid0563]
MKNKGELTDSTFKVTGLKTTRFGGPTPKIFGNYKESEKGTIVEISIKPTSFVYLMEGFAILMVIILIASPNATINGEPANFSERLSFGLFFITFWTLILLFLSYVPFLQMKKKTERDYQLTPIENSDR